MDGVVEPLLKRSQDELGILEINNTSFDKIYVRCTTCGEEFLREMCNLNKLHQCISKQATLTTKVESICNTYKTEAYYAAPYRLECKLEHQDAKLPERKRPTDAGYDLYSIEDATIPPHGTTNINIGIKLACPPGTYYTVEGRSSMWVQGVMPCRGIIDATYVGDLQVRLMNISDNPYYVTKGDRVAQVIIHQHRDADFTIVNKFSPEYNIRGESGFGSSGK